MIEFKKKEWFDKTNTEKRIPISAANLNRIEEGVDAAVKHTNDMTNYWWRKSKVVDAYLELLQYADRRFYLWDTEKETSTIYYSDSVTLKINANTGNIQAELNNPSSDTISNFTVGDALHRSNLKGKYFIVGADGTSFLKNTENDGTIYYCDGNMDDEDRGSQYSPRYGFSVYAHVVSLNKVYGDVEYISSQNPDAYNDGWNDVDACMYEYLGIPFENSRETTKGMITGWYYGDGMSQKLIRTVKKPKCVMVYESIGDSTYLVDYTPYLYGLATEVYSIGSVSIADNGFYVTNEPSYLNRQSTRYYYIVFY